MAPTSITASTTSATTSANTTPYQASPWLMDLIAFLKSVFQSFTNLPPRLAQMACMSSCQHLARSVMALLTQVLLLLLLLLVFLLLLLSLLRRM